LDSCLTISIFQRTIIAKTELVIEVTKAVVMLHDSLMHDRTESRTRYFPSRYADEETSDSVRAGGWRAEGDNLGLNEINQIGSANYSRDTKQVRDDYFFSEDGSLAWQLEVVNSTQTTFEKQ